MQIYVTRDSVCAGDDTDAPHGSLVDIPEHLFPGSLVVTLANRYALPLIAGGEATWVLSSAKPLAVFAQQWSEPRIIHPGTTRMVDLDVIDGQVGAHFSYLAQRDPAVVADVLSNLRLRALR